MQKKNIRGLSKLRHTAGVAVCWHHADAAIARAAAVLVYMASQALQYCAKEIKNPDTARRKKEKFSCKREGDTF